MGLLGALPTPAVVTALRGRGEALWPRGRRVVFLAWWGTTLALAPAAEALDPQRAITQYVRESWIVKDGAPAGTISAIGQTPDGFLWLGTEGDGLVRFDGVSFVRVDALDGVFANRIDQVTSMISGRDGSLWVGTIFGLARFKDGRWTTFDRGEAKHVFGLHEGPDGSIWYARHWDGVFRVKDGVLTAMPLTGKPRFVATDRHGTVWAGGYDGLWRIRDDEKRFYTRRDGLADPNVTGVIRSAKGDVWLTHYVGLSLLHDDKVVSHWTTRDGLSSDEVTAVFEDREGQLWVGTVNGGLNRRRGRGFDRLTKSLGLTDNRVTAIHEDREGSLWVGTASGLNRLRDANLLPIGETEGLSAREPISVAEARDGTIYVSAGFGGLNRIKDGKIEVSLPQTVPGSDFDGPVLVDRDGGVWTGHRDGLSYRKDGRSKLHTLVDGPVNCVVRDDQGLILAGPAGEIFRLVDGKARRYLLADGSPLGREGLGFDYVWQLFVARDGALWLATTRGVFVVREGKPQRIWSQGTLSARSVSEDEEGTIWLGTMAGAVRYKAGAIAAFSTRQGLLEDDLHSVLSDGHGNIWMAGSRGLQRVSRQALDDVARGAASRVEVEAFGVADGMRTSVATASFQPAAALARDGRLWFATTGGMVVVDPGHLKRNVLPPPVLVEGLVADGRPLPPVSPAQVMAGTEQLAIHYNGLSLLVPHRVRFRYRLEGYDRDWVDAGARRVAFYTKLPPGDYRFVVKAANNDGVWNEEGASLAFRLLPRWHQTAAFRVGAGFLAILALAGGHAVRTRGLRARERELEARVSERTTELRREITVREQAERELLAEVAERRKAEDQARESAAFLDSVVENIPASIYVKDAKDLRFLRVNRPAKEVLGLEDRPSEAFVGTTDHDYLGPEQAEAIRSRDREFLASGRPIEVADEPVDTPRGLRYLLSKKMAIKDGAGRPLYLLGISEDITERKRIQEVLERQRDELARSNAELEQFASIASHDLQEPLRKIRSFGERLDASAKSALDGPSRGYLERMLAAAARMQALIEDLLTYSQVGSRTRPRVKVPLDRVVTEVLSDLEAGIEEAGAKVERGPLPTVLADETQMRQLFQNLITNALKFRRPGVAPVVAIEAPSAPDLESGETVVEVRDNGIGIEEEFLERIFAPFERLNPRTEFAGTGIGLAICRKIAERHGGSIVATSRVGVGSVFRVRLPAVLGARREVFA